MARIWIILLIILFPSICLAQPFGGGFSGPGVSRAYEIFTDTDNFRNILTASNYTVQSALETLDQAPASQLTVTTTNFDNVLSSTDNTAQLAFDTIDDVLSSSVPGASTSTCTPSKMAYESGFLYVCVASNSWERVELATWVAGSSFLLLESGDSILLENGDKIIIDE